MTTQKRCSKLPGDVDDRHRVERHVLPQQQQQHLLHGRHLHARILARLRRRVRHHQHAHRTPRLPRSLLLCPPLHSRPVPQEPAQAPLRSSAPPAAPSVIRALRLMSGKSLKMTGKISVKMGFPPRHSLLWNSTDCVSLAVLCFKRWFLPRFFCFFLLVFFFPFCFSLLAVCRPLP